MNSVIFTRVSSVAAEILVYDTRSVYSSVWVVVESASDLWDQAVTILLSVPVSTIRLLLSAS